ncbi:MAG: hypothetical protein ACREJU_15730 [Nitrospiraceae bacterium]
MKAVTLRNLPPHLDKTIRQRAREKRMSINKAVIALLEEHVNLDNKNPSTLHHDLDDLCGSWTKAEATAFEKILTKQRAIDPGLWR